jgi:hypothetical protein
MCTISISQGKCVTFTDIEAEVDVCWELKVYDIDISGKMRNV